MTNASLGYALDVLKEELCKEFSILSNEDFVNPIAKAFDNAIRRVDESYYILSRRL